MAASSGRAFLIKKAGTAIAGCREDTLKVDGSPVDITSKDDSGYRTLASFAGMKSIDIGTSGVFKDGTLRDLALADGSLSLSDITLVFADGTIISGDFYLADYEETGAHDGAQEFTASLQSSGEWTVT